MSDPVNAYPAAGQNQQPAYGQPAYAISPEIEKIRSNASTARMLSFVSFLIGGLLLAGGMWFWTNKMAEEAKILGAPMDVTADVESARSAAKVSEPSLSAGPCTIDVLSTWNLPPRKSAEYCSPFPVARGLGAPVVAVVDAVGFGVGGFNPLAPWRRKAKDPIPRRATTSTPMMLPTMRRDERGLGASFWVRATRPRSPPETWPPPGIGPPPGHD